MSLKRKYTVNRVTVRLHDTTNAKQLTSMHLHVASRTNRLTASPRQISHHAVYHLKHHNGRQIIKTLQRSTILIQISRSESKTFLMKTLRHGEIAGLYVQQQAWNFPSLVGPTKFHLQNNFLMFTRCHIEYRIQQTSLSGSFQCAIFKQSARNFTF